MSCIYEMENESEVESPDYNSAEDIEIDVTMDSDTVQTNHSKVISVVDARDSVSTSINSISNERPWVCKVCDFAFKYKNNMLEHMRFYHMKGQVPCNYCSKVFPSSNVLRKHMQEHSLLAGRCPHCRTILCSGMPVKHQIYETHLAFCARKPKSDKVKWDGLPIQKSLTLRCAKCKSSFLDSLSYDNHVCCEPSNGNLTTDRNMNFRRELFNENINCESPASVVSVESENDTECIDVEDTSTVFGETQNTSFDDNHKKYAENGSLENSCDTEVPIDIIEVVAEDGNKDYRSQPLDHDCTIMYACKYCGKCFTKKEEKRKHKENCTGEDKEVNDIAKFEKENVVLLWVCKYCKIDFSGKELLRAHKLICVDRKKKSVSLHCMGCRATFPGHIVLKKHLEECKQFVESTQTKSSHNQLKNKMWSCLFCGKCFEQRNNYMSHERICQRKSIIEAEEPSLNCSNVLSNVSREIAPEVAAKKWICKRCYGRFNTRAKLRTHRKQCKNCTTELPLASVKYEAPECTWSCKFCCYNFKDRASCDAHSQQCELASDVNRNALKEEHSNNSSDFHNANDAQLKCKCGLHFFDQEIFRKHAFRCRQMPRSNTNMQMMIKCNMCSEIFDSMNPFSLHLLKCSRSQAISVSKVSAPVIRSCKRCGHSYNELSKYLKHPCQHLLKRMQSCVVVLDNIFPDIHKERVQSEVHQSESDSVVRDEENKVDMSCVLPLEVILEEKQNSSLSVEKSNLTPVLNSPAINNEAFTNNCEVSAVRKPTGFHVSHVEQECVYAPIINIQENVPASTHSTSNTVSMHMGSTVQLSPVNIINLNKIPDQNKTQNHAIEGYSSLGSKTGPLLHTGVNNSEVLRNLLTNTLNTGNYATNNGLPVFVQNNHYQLSSEVTSELHSTVDAMMKCDGFVLGNKSKYICRHCYRSYETESKFYRHSAEEHNFSQTTLKFYDMKFARDNF